MKKYLFKRRRKPNCSVWGDTVNLLFLLFIAVFMSLPLVYAICQSIKPMEELFVFPPTLFVRNPTLDNFVDVMILMGESWVPFSRYILNSLFITIIGTIGYIFCASMAAYVLEKHRFHGRNLFFALVITALMFSNKVTSIPNYIVMSKLGFIDTYLSLIIPAFGAPFGLYLMKQFMCQVPDSIIECARIDAATEFQIYRKIILPMVKPAWLTLIIFSVQELWNAPAGTFIYSEQLKTLPNALQQIAAAGLSRAGASAAVAVIIMVVPITVFIVNQSNIIETMSTSGMKE